MMKKKICNNCSESSTGTCFPILGLKLNFNQNESDDELFMIIDQLINSITILHINKTCVIPKYYLKARH